jgi:hypothetical protein
MKPIAIDDIKVMNLGLGRSIYSPAQLEEFARFQESQRTRRAFLAESAERPTTAGPVALLVLFLVGILRMLLDIVIRAIAIAKVRGCGWWLMGAF